MKKINPSDNISSENNNKKRYSSQRFTRRRPYNNRPTGSGHGVSHDHAMCGHDHKHTFVDEILCHIPLSIMAFCLSLCAFFILNLIIKAAHVSTSLVYGDLFHLLHYSHVLFAAVGIILSLYRFVRQPAWYTVIAVSLIPLLFCTVSDIVFPSVGASLFSINIPVHLCFSCWSDLQGLLCFWVAGIIAGLGLAKGSALTTRSFVSIFHFGHVFLGVIASFSYLLFHGMEIFAAQYYQLFILSVVSTIIPCTLSDTILPLLIGLFKKKSHNVYKV